MQTPTEAQIRARLEAMLGEVSEIKLVITTEDATLPANMLLAARVYAGRAQRSRDRGRQLRTVTRDWYIALLIKRIGGENGRDWSATQKREAEIAAEQYLELIPDFFALHPNLMIDGKQMTGVESVGEPRDNGLQTITFGADGAIYFGAVYELPITIKRA